MNLFPRLSLSIGLLSLAACGSTPAAPIDAGTTTDNGTAYTDHGTAPTDNGTTPAACTGTCPVVRHLAGGGRFTCAALEGGAVRCWGEGGSGQLGDRGTATRTSPVAVMGLADVAQVSAGYEHACARKTDGTVWCWGAGSNGRLGNGASVDSPAPVQVTGITNAVTVSAGYYHSCAVTADGRALCWGRGSDIGTGSISSSNTPVAVMGVAGAVDVAAGRSTSAGNSPTSCAVVAGGAVRCWGDGGEGQLGNGTRDSSLAPVAVTGITNARSVVVGAVHACALLTDGTVSCWGEGSAGAVGPNGQDFTTTPVTVTGIAGAQSLVAGDGFTCALLTGGTLQCWGRGPSGELGRGAIPAVGADRSPAPAPVVGLSGVTLLAAGAQHVCVFAMDGATRCWGSDFAGQLGVGGDPMATRPSAATPAPVRW